MAGPGGPVLRVVRGSRTTTSSRRWSRWSRRWVAGSRPRRRRDAHRGATAGATSGRRSDRDPARGGRPGCRAEPVTVRLVLASASSGRLAVLRAAGVAPDVVVSGVDETDVTGPAEHVALELARRKAARGRRAARLGGCPRPRLRLGPGPGRVDARQARRRRRRAPALARDARAHRRPGHRPLPGRRAGRALRAPGRTVAAVDTTPVRFADVTDDEVDAYVATGEPQRVAGAFTIDGLGGWFVAAVTGAPSNVVGLSLPLLREPPGRPRGVRPGRRRGVCQPLTWRVVASMSARPPAGRECGGTDDEAPISVGAASFSLRHPRPLRTPTPQLAATAASAMVASLTMSGPPSTWPRRIVLA